MAFKLESVVPWGRNMQEYRGRGNASLLHPKGCHDLLLPLIIIRAVNICIFLLVSSELSDIIKINNRSASLKKGDQL